MDRNFREERAAGASLLSRPIESLTQAERERLEWLAAISPRHERRLLDLKREEANARREREHLEWLAQISPRHEVKLRRLLKEEAEAQQEKERSERLSASGTQEAWDPAKHPRAGGPPNPGWYASTTGGAGAAGDSERATTNIRLRSGDKWSGDGILDVVTALAPGWLPFVKRHLTLAVTSNRSATPTTTVRSGEYGPKVKNVANMPSKTRRPMSVHFDIPAAWNDAQAVNYILKQLADDVDVHVLAADWATHEPKLFKQITSERFKNGLSTIETLAKSYYLALAGASLGGQAAVAFWDIQNGDHVSAALDVAFLLPFGAIAKSGLEATGTIALRAGEKLIGALPVKVIQQIGKLAPEQKALLHTRLLAAKTGQEAAEIVEKFLGTQFDAHHPLPKFLGGDTKQLLATVPKSAHEEFHALLREDLKATGLNLRIGGAGGSTTDWLRYFEKNPGSQGKAFAAVLKASRATDAKHGTSITQWVWKNLVGNNFIAMP